MPESAIYVTDTVSTINHNYLVVPVVLVTTHSHLRKIRQE